MQAQTLAAPGERVIGGERFYSAAFLNDRPRDARSALDRARSAWAVVQQQLELDLELVALEPAPARRRLGRNG